jgi:hypothetical protein
VAIRARYLIIFCGIFLSIGFSMYFINKYENENTIKKVNTAVLSITAEHLNKLIEEIQSEPGVYTSLNLPFSKDLSVVYFVIDQMGKITMSSESAARGKELHGTVNINKKDEITKVKYKGKNFWALLKKNDRFNFSILVMIPLYSHSWYYPSMIVVCVAFGTIITLLISIYKRKIHMITVAISKAIDSPATDLKTENKTVRQLIEKINQTIRSREQLLQKAASELQRLKEILKKLNEKRS